MINLNFDDGFKEIKINGDENRVVRWNPTDINFVDRFLAFQDWLRNDFYKIAKKFEGSEFRQSEDGGAEIVGYKQGDFIKFGKILNEKLDETFGEGFSEAAFQGANPLSPTPTGLLFVNFINALEPIISESIDKNSAAINEYVNKANNIKKQVSQSK